MRTMLAAFLLFASPCLAQELAPIHRDVHGYVYTVDTHDDGETILGLELCNDKHGMECVTISTEGREWISGIAEVVEDHMIVARVTAYVRPDGEIEIFLERVWSEDDYMGTHR